MKIAITGHRPHKFNNDYELKSDRILKIRSIIVEYFTQMKPDEVIVGLSLGIDTLVAEVCIEMGIKFTAAIPCKNQWMSWPQRSIDRYNKILAHELCTVYNVSTDFYTHWCMNDRNKWMVDNADELLSVWDGSSGGTYNCIKYAGKKEPRMRITNIHPETFILSIVEP